jgi:cytochrome c peroxidase
MNWKVVGVLGFAAIVLMTGLSTSGSLPFVARDWRADYRHPVEIPFPEDNPYSQAKTELGRSLFFDPVLSGSRERSCASCHNPGLSWGDGLPKAIGEGDATMSRRTPTALNLAWVTRFGWDGKFRDLEAFTFGPINSATNMNSSEAAVIKRLTAIPGYVQLFSAAFGEGPITRGKIEDSLATFERSIVSATAPFDRWVLGDETAIEPAAKRGFALFDGKGRCSECHSGWAFTDGSFHDIGTAEGDDIGRGRLFPTSVKLRYAFKTPTLRDVARRAPYMHDGSVRTLEDVIALYDRGGIERPSRSELITPLGLTQGEKADLVAFLETLTSREEPTLLPILPR